MIHALSPLPDVPGVRAKLLWLSAHRNKYDTLFIGSSRVNQQISPEIFDARMSEHGMPTRSLNLGIDAMTFPELPYFVDRVLQSKPKHLHNVVFDLNPLRQKTDESDFQSLRSIYWHNFHYTAMVWKSIWFSEQPDLLAKRIGWLSIHARLLLLNMANVGGGAEWIKNTAIPSLITPLRNAGYSPSRRQMSAEDRAKYATLLEEMEAAEPRGTKPDRALAAAFDELLAKLERSKVHSFFFIGSTVMTTRPLTPQTKNHEKCVVFAFDDPARFPALYDPANRQDTQHLNAKGSDLFTGLLADMISASLEEKAQADR